MWTRFLALLRERGIADSSARWHLFRAEQFLKARPDRNPATCAAEEITGYLTEAERTARLEAWQYRQLVEALEVLFAGVLELAWAVTFDWSFWRDSAQRLETGHATLGRHQSAREHDLQKPGPETPAPQEHLLAAVAAEITRRAYSIRTERTYLHWIRRFAASFHDRDPRELGAAEV